MTTSRTSTQRAAAQVVDVSPATIRYWIDKGWLNEGPWTEAQLKRAAQQSRQTSGRGSRAAHGTPNRWRTGCPCDLCRAAHSRDTSARHSAQQAAWWEGKDAALIELITDGTPYGDALKQVGVSTAAITGHRQRNPQFASDLDDALMHSRDPDLTHATSHAWQAKCRCPECRDHHNASR